MIIIYIILPPSRSSPPTLLSGKIRPARRRMYMYMYIYIYMYMTYTIIDASNNNEHTIIGNT